MKNLLCGIALLLAAPWCMAQDASMTRKGNSVYVENLSKNENAVKTTHELVAQLNEWDYWQVTDNKAEADFILHAEVSSSDGMTLTSWGGTSYELVTRLKDKNDEVFWESNRFKASPNGTNGFNAGKSVVKKLMRTLKKKYS